MSNEIKKPYWWQFTHDFARIDNWATFRDSLVKVKSFGDERPVNWRQVDLVEFLIGEGWNVTGYETEAGPDNERSRLVIVLDRSDAEMWCKVFDEEKNYASNSVVFTGDYRGEERMITRQAAWLEEQWYDLSKVLDAQRKVKAEVDRKLDGYDVNGVSWFHSGDRMGSGKFTRMTTSGPACHLYPHEVAADYASLLEYERRQMENIAEAKANIEAAMRATHPHLLGTF